MRRLCVLLVCGLFACESKSPQEIEVWVLQPTSRITGLDWPSQKSGLPESMVLIKERCVINVRLPSGLTLALKGRGGALRADGGMVYDLSVWTSDEKSSFQEAVQAAIAVVESTTLPKKADFARQVRDLQQKNPQANDRSFVVNYLNEPGVTIYVEIRSLDTSPSSWVVSTNVTRRRD